LATLDRVKYSILPTPFWSDRKELQRLDKVREEWVKAYMPYRQELEEVGGLLNQASFQ